MPDLPDEGYEIDRVDVERPHPEYSEKAQFLRLFRECYQANGGFAPSVQPVKRDTTAVDDRGERDEYKTYLVPHAGEDTEDFRDRVQMAYLPNFVKHRVISPLTGFLTDKPPERQGMPPEVEAWQEDCTLDGLDLDTWYGDEGVPYGLVYGTLPVLVDSDPGDFETEADRMAAGAEFAKMRVIHPDAILDWARDKTGRLAAFKYKATLDSWDPIKGHKNLTRYTWILPEGYFWVDDDPMNPLSRLPVGGSGVWPWVKWKTKPQAPVAEVSLLGHESLLQDVAPMVQRLFNGISELTELQRKQAFSILFVPGGKRKDAQKVGTSRFWGLPEEVRQMPQYVAPPAGPFDHYLAFLGWIIQLIQEMGHTASFFGAGAEAAATMAYRFQNTQRFLQRLAKGLVKFEYHLSEIVALWHGTIIPESASINYMQTFDAVDIERFLNWMDVALNNITLPPTAKALVQRRVIHRILPDRTEREDADIETELELGVETETQADATREEMLVQPPQGLEVPGDGREP
jgi:hypothetical protein